MCSDIAAAALGVIFGISHSCFVSNLTWNG